MEKIIRGDPRLTRKNDLDEVLEAVKANSDDVFCDLGCGEGLLCIWASERLKYAYGIEFHRRNYSKAQENKGRYNRSNVRFIYKDYNNIEEIPELKKCTIFFCSNGLDYDFYQRLEKFLKGKKFFFASQYFAPYPILSKKCEYGFIMKAPFKMAKNEKEWVQYMLGKNKTMEDLLKFIRRFPNYKDNKEELQITFDFVNWIRGLP
ncbi:MAG TPA: class I SAM-dependent methyltransferase [Nitrosopumilaceae archaeon]|nr:class I SAM-dependent methyltransferase [Nitrosopumilaceae archaeon]